MGIFSKSDNRRRDGGFPYMGSRHLDGAYLTITIVRPLRPL